VKKRIVLALPLLILACSGGETDRDLQITVPVSVEEVKTRPIEEFVTTTGTAKSIKEVTLKSESSGLYKRAVNPRSRRPFVLGDRVSQGEVIIELENPEQINNIKIESQKLNLDISQREFEKQQSLYEKGGVTLRELKTAEKSLMDAKYTYENAVIALTKMKITAPFTGSIVDLPYFTENTLVAVGSAMVQIMDYSKMYMETSLPGKEMERIRVGQKCRIMNYSLPKDTLSGQIAQVSPALNPDTRSFKGTLEIDNPVLLLRPGMFVKSEIVVARKDSAIVISKEVILARQRGKTIFVVDKGAAEERIITTGIENPDVVEVVNGLRKDERLIVKGFETLQNRSKVKIIR
jgi:membrane fusion protein, multidrug efflux system